MSRFVPNHNLEAELAAQVVPALTAAAKTVASRVEEEKHSIMPRRRSGSVVVSDGPGLAKRVNNTDFGAHLDEWGSVNNPPYSPIRRAVRAVGLRLTERGK